MGWLFSHHLHIVLKIDLTRLNSIFDHGDENRLAGALQILSRAIPLAQRSDATPPSLESPTTALYGTLKSCAGGSWRSCGQRPVETLGADASRRPSALLRVTA
jgi:hypothetical protein